MSEAPSSSIEIRIQEDVIRARQAGRAMALDLGFSTADQTRLATAISELARNALKYAGSGVCDILACREHDVASVHVEVSDQGPGISDVDAALSDGFTTGGGLGAGLPGAKRLADDFEIHSRPGGTQVKITMTRRLG